MKRALAIAIATVVSLGIAGISGVQTDAQVAPRITKEELKARLDNPDVIIIDVRIGRDWNDSTLKIKGALREDPRDVSSWMNKYSRDKTIVFYCG